MKRKRENFDKNRKIECHFLVDPTIERIAVEFVQKNFPKQFKIETHHQNPNFTFKHCYTLFSLVFTSQFLLQFFNILHS